MTESTTVLIVGAGPTGLALACELARRDVPFRLVEASAGPQQGSRGKGLQPRTLEVFEGLGVIDAIMEHGEYAMAMESIAPDGQVRRGGAVPESLVGRPDIPYAASLIIPEWRVEEALRARLGELGGQVEFGAALVRLTQSNGRVQAEIERDGVTQAVDARWLVGCDGGHSIVRKQAGIAFVGETRDDVRMIVADVAVDGLDRSAWRLWRHARGIVSLCPLPSTDLFQLQAGVVPGEEPRFDLESLQGLVAEATGRDDLLLHEPEWTSLWRANVRLADRYRDGGVFVAGDAAHIHSPAGGQGMNTGIQDAANLGWKLAVVAAGADEALLDTYESERRPVAEHVLALSNARLAATITSGEVSTKRDESTIQLDVGYRGSRLAVDDRGGAGSGDGALRAGDRAPDATGIVSAANPGGGRLFDLLRGGRFTLLCFGDSPSGDLPGGPRILRVVDDATRAGEIVDRDGTLRRAFGARDTTLVLIRPDGYVGVVSDAGDAEVVRDYLAPLVATDAG